MVMTNGKNGNHKPHKLKFLFVSYEAESGDIAWQIKKEGHEVRFATISTSGNEEVYKGLLGIEAQEMDRLQRLGVI